ncbi:MAG: BatD family protein [Chitinispirillales bacterium]|nr:BatD family protein [Chitinispirillales bacterium]
MKHITICIFLLFLSAALTPASASQVSFAINTERTVITNGEQAVLVATLTTPKPINASAVPAPPQNEMFDLLNVNSSQSQSHQIQNINGAITQTRVITYRFNYTIRPKAEGRFTFPALSVNIDGTDYSTQPVDFRVSSEPVKNADITASLHLSKRSLFPGEQALLTLKIAQKNNTPIQTQRGYMSAIEQIEKSFGKEFSLNRLFTNSITQGQERINGEIYNTFTLKFSIFALTAGTYSIPSIAFEYDEIRQTGQRRVNPFFNDFFDDFFGGSQHQAVRQTTHTAPFNVTVKPLPQNTPANFNGSVGKFSLNASVEPQNVAAGEALTLRITLRGNTRPSNIGDPVLPDLKDCDIFTPERQSVTDTAADGFSTRKTYRYLIIPKTEGALNIGPITYPYLDPESGTYKTARSNQLTVNVTPGKGGSREQTRYLTQDEIQMVGHDIRYIKSTPKICNQSVRPYRDPYWYLLFPLPFLLFLFVVIYKLHSKQSGKNQFKNMRQKALSTALRELNKINKETVVKPDSEFLGKVALTIEKYISHKFAFPATGRTLEELKAELLSRNIDEHTATGLASLIENIDEYRFGGKTFNTQGKSELTAKTAAFLTSMEKSVQKERSSPATAAASVLLIVSALVIPSFANTETDSAFEIKSELNNAENTEETASLLSPQNPQAWFEKANEFYAAGSYDSAQTYYSKIVDAGISSSVVFYNLGNTFHRLRKPGLSRLYYEKAALLSPKDADIQANIRFIKTIIVDRSEERAESDFLTAVFYNIHTLLPLQSQLVLLFLLTLILALFGAGILFKSGLNRLWFAYGATLCTILILATGISAGYKIYALESRQYAIILSPSLDAKNQPMGTQTLFTAHEGTKLQIRKNDGEWCLVSLPNGASGWVLGSSLGKI